MGYQHIKSKNAVKPEGYKPKDTKLTPLFREFRACTDEKRRKVLRDELAMSNYPLACKVAKRFRAQWSLDSVPIEDLIQTAMIGILNAIDLYDPDVAAFSGFGGLYALSKCQRMAIEEGHDVFPPAKSDVLKRLKDFRILEGREPTAEELGVDEKTHKAIYAPKVHVQRLETIIEGQRDEGGYDHDDNLAGAGLNPEEIAMVAEALAAMPEELAEAYELHYVNGMTPRQMAKELGIKSKDVDERLTALVQLLKCELIQ